MIGELTLFLEKISLLGFKSFIKKQEVKLSGSLNFIVGPNGCGKSNLLDAIRFCIGEDNVSILRVKNITDLISASKSEESNFSEVTLFLTMKVYLSVILGTNFTSGEGFIRMAQVNIFSIMIL